MALYWILATIVALPNLGVAFYFLSGWKTLAKLYGGRANRDPRISWRFRSGKIGRSPFPNSLRIGSDSEGLHLGVMLPLGIAYRPLLIPWSDVAISLKKRAFFKSREYWEFHFGALEAPTLRLGKRLGQEVIRSAGQS